MSKKSLSNAYRIFVRTRAKGHCEYCMSRDDCSTNPFDTEHIISTAHNGTDELDNLAYACSGCNGYKFTKIEGYDTVSERFVSLFNPRTQLWNDHFFWNNTATLIVGKTPIGRATIDTLKMNRPPLINLRKAMVLLGIHPPK